MKLIFQILVITAVFAAGVKYGEYQEVQTHKAYIADLRAEEGQ